MFEERQFFSETSRQRRPGLLAVILTGRSRRGFSMWVRHVRLGLFFTVSQSRHRR